MADEWQSQKFRQSVVAKINEVIQNSAMDPSKNANVMENHIFKKAKNREEYLGLVAKLFIHFREINNRPHQPQSRPPQGSNTGELGTGNSSVQDPINALQNLAVQGNRNPQLMQMAGNQNQQMGVAGPGAAMASGGTGGVSVAGNVAASNLLQTLTQRPNPQVQNSQGIRNVNAQMIGQNNINPQMNNNNMSNYNPNMNIGNMSGVGQVGVGGVIGANNTQMQMLPSQMPNAGHMQMGNNMQMTNNMQIGNTMQNQTINHMQNVGQIPLNQMNQNQLNIGGMNNPQLNQMMTRINNNNQTMNPINQNNIPNQSNVPQILPSVSTQSEMNINVLNPQVGLNQPTTQMNQQSNINQMINMQNMGQKPQNIAVNNSQNIFQTNRNVGQTQFLRQSPSPTVASPAGMNQSQQPLSHQSTTQMIPSPALVPSSSPQMSNMMTNNQRALRQSPNGPLNTPGQVTGSSPFNPQEDQLYREKYKQLTKYIEPLRRMVAKIGNDDVEKITKMNKLLEILTNPHQRIPLETLLKCEKALEKMDFKSCLYPIPGHQFGTNNPLLEAVNSTLQNPIGNHTLQRTFRPCLEAFFGSDIKPFPTADKQIGLMSEDNPFLGGSEIPHVLQGEIARLDQKFKVSLDPSSQMNTNIIKLICCIDDKRLPCVPPLVVTIAEDYPLTSPVCSLTQQEYSATPFLLTVQNALMARLSKLPKCHSLSHLLDTWEMSVRHACSPKTVTLLEQVFVEQFYNRDIDEEKLIEEVRKNPVIYDKSSDGYKNIRKKNDSWAAIALQLNVDETQCKNKWESLRDRYTTESKLKHLPSGSVNPKREFFDSLSFLKDHMHTRMGRGNFDDSSSDVFSNEDNIIIDESSVGCSSTPIMEEEKNKDKNKLKKKKRKIEDPVESKFIETLDKFQTYLNNPSTSAEIDKEEEFFMKGAADMIRTLNSFNQAKPKAEIMGYLSKLKMQELMRSQENIFL